MRLGDVQFSNLTKMNRTHSVDQILQKGCLSNGKPEDRNQALARLGGAVGLVLRHVKNPDDSFTCKVLLESPILEPGWMIELGIDADCLQVVPYFRVGKRRMKVLDGATERGLDDPVHRSSYPDWDIGWDSSDYDDPNASESEFRGPKPDDDD